VFAAAVDGTVCLDPMAVRVAEGEHGWVVACELLARDRHAVRLQAGLEPRETGLVGQLEAEVGEPVTGRELERVEALPPAEPDGAVGERLAHRKAQRPGVIGGRGGRVLHGEADMRQRHIL
jgi:hypothetical protein